MDRINQRPDPYWPRWIADLHRLLGIRPQFLLSGPIRDLFLTPLDGQTVLLPILDSLWEALTLHGYQYLLVYDRVDGLRLHPDTPAIRSLASRTLHQDFQGAPVPISFNRLPTVLRALITANVRAAAIIDSAARVPVSVQQLSEAEHEFFTACEKLAYVAHPIITTPDRPPLFNPLLWLCHREIDLPSWFTLDNEAIHRLTLPPPGYDERRHAAALLAPAFADHDQATAEQQRQFADSFAQLIPLTIMFCYL
ncbi:MAG: hypothetical protein KDJ28_16570 [Candidatus Competibacteraceae bacterium]|nr:hypothetical protein [Candidatus Competibacteraceae bacterium]